MSKIIRIFILLVVVSMITAYSNQNFFKPSNLSNITERASLYGIISLGAAFVIMTGGIDLSIGSMVGLTGVLFPYLLVHQHWSLPATLLAVLSLAVFLGLIHGLLITKLKLQPFVVTLCGMMIYRGLGRWITRDETQGYGEEFKWLTSVTSSISLSDSIAYKLPIVAIILLVLTVICWILLNKMIFGRYLLAIGRNEQAVKYSGIKTDKYIIGAYVLCALFAGIDGILYSLEAGSVQPSIQGNFHELYAIAAAVLGGCSLRGGEGTVIGVVLGAALIPLINNMINLIGISTTLEFSVIGAVILIGAIVDQTFHIWSRYLRFKKTG
jgi:ribose transport system permease protein